MKENEMYRLLWPFYWIDVILIFLYIFLPRQTLNLLLTIFDWIFWSPGFFGYRIFVWKCFLFIICSVASFFRAVIFHESLSFSKKRLVIQLMVLLYFLMSLKDLYSDFAAASPFFILDLGLLNYLYEILIVSGAGYIFSDFLRTLFSTFSNLLRGSNDK